MKVDEVCSKNVRECDFKPQCLKLSDENSDQCDKKGKERFFFKLKNKKKNI